MNNNIIFIIIIILIGIIIIEISYVYKSNIFCFKDSYTLTMPNHQSKLGQIMKCDLYTRKCYWEYEN